jgi:uncharacterized protein YjiS (DUF1127 family)
MLAPSKPETDQMLYRPIEAAPRPQLTTRIWSALATALAGIGRQRADTQYLDSLSRRDLEDLGLRRSCDRDYPSLR